MLCPQWAQTRYVVASVCFRSVRASEGDMTGALLVRHRQGAVTLCQFRWSCESVPKNVQWHQRLDIVTARYALKSSSTNGKDSSAMTVAEKDRSIETPRFTGLPLVLPGRSRAYFHKEPRAQMKPHPGISRSHLLLTLGSGEANPLRSREGHTYGSEQCPTSMVGS